MFFRIWNVNVVAYRLWDNCSKKGFLHSDTFSSEKFVSSTCLQARTVRLDASSLTCDRAIYIFYFLLLFCRGKKSPDRRLYPPGSLSYDSTLLSAFFSVTRVLKKRRQRRQRKWQKINRLRLAMNNISLFCVHFLSVVARLRPATSWFHGFHRGREHVTTS